MSLSGFTFIRNGVSLGYPFVEAILSVLPICDEFVITECYSDDSTYYWCKRLEKTFPKIRVVREKWGQLTTSGQSIGEMQTKALRHCGGWYALCIQSDEVWHQDSVKMFGNLIKDATSNSYSFSFDHIGHNFQSRLPYHEAAYTKAIRCVRNIPAIEAEWDGWQFKGQIEPSVYVPLPVNIAHVGYEFPLNIARKYISHASLYPDLEGYQNNATMARKNLESGEFDTLYDLTISPFNLPEIMKELIGVKEYYVRESLFTSPEKYIEGLKNEML